MEIKFNNIILANDSDNIVKQIEVNGAQVIQEAHFFRAAQAGFFARGNKGIILNIEIKQTFASTAQSESFSLTHRNILPDCGDLIFVTGDTNETRLVCESKKVVLESVQTIAHESYTTTRYIFRGNEITTSGQIDPVDGGHYDGGDYGTPTQGSIDGGHYTDSLTPDSLNIDGGIYA